MAPILSALSGPGLVCIDDEKEVSAFIPGLCDACHQWAGSSSARWRRWRRSEKCLLQSRTARLHLEKQEEISSVFVFFQFLSFHTCNPPTTLDYPPPLPPNRLFGYTDPAALPPRSPPLSLISGRGAPIQQGAAGSRWAERRGATWESVACGGGSDGGACGGRWGMTGAARPAGGWAARRPRRSWSLTWRKGPAGSTPWTPGRGRRRRWSRTLTPAAWRTWWWRLGSWVAWRVCFWECTSVGRTREVEVNRKSFSPILCSLFKMLLQMTWTANVSPTQQLTKLRRVLRESGDRK